MSYYYDIDVGLLAPVRDLTATVLNKSNVLLMWSAPYTLDNVPIIGYNVNDDRGTLIDTVNTTDYILEACNIVNVYVSGINGAGIGDSNNVMLNIARGIYYGTNIDFITFYITVPQTLPMSVVPTIEEDSILFQVLINVSL